MPRHEAELAQTAKFDAQYDLARAPVMQAICEEVCGCGYIGTSWTTLEEADALVDLLGLRRGSLLLELGAGAGWPGLYLAKRSLCRAVLVDLPEVGLAIARERAEADGIAERIEVIVADAAAPPLPAASFDAINHSDLLCCLLGKREVLATCRKVIAPEGRMAFSAISVAPGLSQSELARAISCGPEFMESDDDYASMLESTGWAVIERRDLTKEYEAACRRQIIADDRARGQLEELLGTAATRERARYWKRKHAAIRDRITLRELFVAVPGG